MSASKEKKIQQQDAERKAQVKTKWMVIAIAAIVVILLALSLVINSKAIRRSATAVTVGDTSLSVAEYNYYYFNAYYNYYSQVYSGYSDYASSMLPESGKPLKSQVYDEETGETWADFFDGIALDSIKSVVASYEEGKKNGFELTDEQIQDIQDEFDQAKDSATAYGYSSFADYLESYYGKGMNEDTFYDAMYRMHYANYYSQSVRDGFTYTADELASHYGENKDMLDTYTYRYFYISADTVNEEDYEDDEEGLEAAQEEAMNEAKTKADAYVADIKSEADFIAAAKDFNAETYGEENSTLRHYAGNILGSVYGIWLRDAERKSGDVYAAELENRGYYVVYFIDRSGNDYATVDAHIITLNAETVSESDYEDDNAAFEAAQTEALEAVKNEANELLKTWNADSDHSVENFVKYYTDNSDDTSTEDGYSEYIYKYQYTDDMDAWLFDASRKEGDTAVFSNAEEDTYYIVYFDQTDMNYCDYLADSEMREDDYDAWSESITADISVKKGALFSLAR